MCQIVYAPKKSLLIMEDLEKSQDNNPDGFGIAYAKDGRLFYCKKMADFSVFKKALALVPDDVPLVIHFRYTTHGLISKENIHPFEVLNKQSDDTIDLCMAHNGTVNSIHSYGEKKSDTHLYVEKILRPILKESPHLIFNEGFQLLVQRDIGNHNKFIFFNGEGKVAWINKQAGHVPTKCSELWYANEYSLKDSYRSTKNKNYTSQEERWRQFFHQQNLPLPGQLGLVTKHNNNNNNNNTTVEHPDTKYFNFHEVETEVPEEIRVHLKDTEQLLVNKHIDKVSLQGWGWVKYNNNCARWDRNISPIHKRWKITTDSSIQKELDIKAPVVIETTIEKGLAKGEEELQRTFEKSYDEKTFRILTQPEILNWVLDYPEEAAAWSARNGFFGTKGQILTYLLEVQGAADDVCDYIFKVSRKLNGALTLNEILENRNRKKA